MDYKGEEQKKKMIVNRIAKAIGHTKSIKTMVEQGRDCSEVLIQLAAVKSALNNAGKELLKDEMEKMLQEAVEENNPQKIKELNRMIDTFLK